MHQTTVHTDPVTDSAYTISTVNNKGGVGKTTITANIAALCADLGQRVLLICVIPSALQASTNARSDKSAPASSTRLNLMHGHLVCRRFVKHGRCRNNRVAGVKATARLQEH